MKQGWHITTSYPTRSLKEYLAYQSAPHTQNSQPSLPTIEMVVDVGDGREETIRIDNSTDIEQSARQFCRKHKLQEYVADLLANSMRQRYKAELEEAQCQDLAIQYETIAETHANPHAREVLLPQSLTSRDSNSNRKQKESRNSAEKGASKILKGSYMRNKKYSLGENYLMENKENQPELNKASLEICEKLGKQNILQHKNKRSQEKRKALLREIQQKQAELMRQCPFHPKINAISKQVDKQIAYSNVQSRTERFERLYEDHRQMELRRQEERQNYLQELPFKPAINHISRKIMEGKRAADDSQDKFEKKSHMVCSHASNNSLPHTGRKPINRNTQNLPIGEYLYSKAMKKSKPKPTPQKAEVKALNHSDHLVVMLKERRINEVFSELTQPPHQELHCDQVDINDKSIKFGQYRLFVPIFTEMIEMGISLTRAVFMDASLNLIKTLSPEQKHEIIFPKEKQMQQQVDLPHTMFKSRSRDMTKRSGHDQAGIYSRGVEHRRYIQEKNEKQREDLARHELKQCTFRPLLNQK